MSKKKSTFGLSARELRKKLSGSYMIKHIADKDIDCSDIPELTEEQMRKFRPMSKKKRAMIASAWKKQRKISRPK
jgi:hypothetical protein